ncbi:RNA interference and gene silencing protein [Grosmannia clavigera kw1407]|uniref:RNA interference and gene silencing protein n=1 Tax=Grosmannia clavigera (strain kw1407 / UAMH 11150) TaxID=655863 RepID=F0XQE2_GROCL|nr:RNA interference and gene silencing protein [Grosmannia clavigera kw1407]EFX00205.1 RNA interference and gene silencing protein [Grosmannia clavigera kw1407]
MSGIDAQSTTLEGQETHPVVQSPGKAIRVLTNYTNSAWQAAHRLVPVEEAGLLESFGLHVDTSLLDIEARILALPGLQYKNLIVHPDGIGANWSLADVQFQKPVELKSDWQCIVLAAEGEKISTKVERRVQGLCNLLNKCGVENSNPEISRAPLTELEAQLIKAKEAGRRLVLVVLQTQFPEEYAQVKQISDIRVGVSTMCVFRETLKGREGKKKISAAQLDTKLLHIASQINIKLQGCNMTLTEASSRDGDSGNNSRSSSRQSLDSASSSVSDLSAVRSLPALDLVSTMIVGIDVTHPSEMSVESAPSIAAVVASMDADLSQWPAELRAQKGNTEMVADLCDMMEAQLLRWRTKHRGGRHPLPKTVLIYRDGVSESQYEKVKQLEVSQVKKAFEKVYGESGDDLPELAVVVVVKRHHTRFYPVMSAAGRSDRDPRNGTTLPGTVVSDNITSGTYTEFFLQPNRPRRVLVRPARYVVLIDDIFPHRCSVREPVKCKSKTGVNLSSPRRTHSRPTTPLSATDALQAITLALCFINGRGSSAVHIVTPVHYADMACGHARHYLRAEYVTQNKRDGKKGKRPAAADSREEAAEQQEKITVHEDIKTTMFYL